MREMQKLPLPPKIREKHVPHRGKAFWRTFIRGIFEGMPERIVEIYEDDRRYPLSQEGEVIVDNVGVMFPLEVRNAEVFSNIKDLLQQVGGHFPGKSLQRDLGIPFTDHVNDDHSIGTIALQVSGEIGRPEDIILWYAFFPIILTVEKDKVNTHRRRGVAEVPRNFNEYRDTARSIIGTGNRFWAVLWIAVPIGSRSRIVVGTEEDPPLRRHVVVADDINEVECITRREGGFKLLQGNVGTKIPQSFDNVVLHLTVPGGAGMSWTDLALLDEEGVCGFAIEMRLGATPATSDETHEDGCDEDASFCDLCDSAIPLVRM